jgi:hypothetical protein
LRPETLRFAPQSGILPPPQMEILRLIR